MLGLDITTSSVKLVELGMSGDRYRLEAYAAEPTPVNSVNEKAIVDVEAVGEAVRRAYKRSGARAKDAAVAISGDAAITKIIQMPAALNEGELEGQVQLQADQYIPFPMEEVSYDFEVQGRSERDPDMLEVLLVATRTMYDQGVGLQNSPSSAHLARSTSVRLNPADFDQLGVADGTTVRVATARGSVDAPAVSDGGVPKGTAAMVFNQANASAAALIDASTRVTAVRVERP